MYNKTIIVIVIIKTMLVLKRLHQQLQKSDRNLTIIKMSKLIKFNPFVTY